MKTWNDLIELSKKNERQKAAGEQKDVTEPSNPEKTSADKSHEISIHAGHRLRMRERFEKDPDLESFAEHEVLELLLFNSVCRKDTNAIAHKLINEFGSLVDVLDASFDSLRKAGLSDAGAAQIKQVLAVANYYLLNKNRHCVFLNNTTEVTGYFGVYFSNKNNECVYAALLDANGKILSIPNLGRGGPTSTEIDTYKLISAVSAKGAVRVVLMHNHPAGNLLPSNSDIAATGNIMVQLAIVQASLIDHIVFGSDGNYFSFYQNGLISALGERCNAFIGDCGHNNNQNYLFESARLLSYGGKGKHLNLKSYESLENKISNDIDLFGYSNLDNLYTAVKSNPVYGNFYKK